MLLKAEGRIFFVTLSSLIKYFKILGGINMTTLTKRTRSPFRYDVVGSYLRPAELKDARAQFSDGEITKEDLKAVEDKVILELIQKQEAVGLKAVTDGEFRRSWWHLDFFWGLNGVEKVEDGGYQFHGEYTRAETARLSGPISGENHPFVEEFKFVRNHVSEGIEVKQTFPAPAQFIAELHRPENLASTREFYPTNDALVEGIAKAYQQVIKELYEAGARTIQLDDCTWGTIVSENPEGIATKDQLNSEDKEEAEKAQTREKLKELYITVNNLALEGAPEDLVINTHVCRGNYHSDWATEGAYNEVATPLFDRGNYQAYFLEYDTDRAGGFEPLAHISDDKVVVLGLVTSKDGVLEDRQTLIDRIHEAAEYVPLDRLCLSPQCGFASTEEGNILTEEEQWEKIKLVQSVAEEVWG